MWRGVINTSSLLPLWYWGSKLAFKQAYSQASKVTIPVLLESKSTITSCCLGGINILGSRRLIAISLLDLIVLFWQAWRKESAGNNSVNKWYSYALCIFVLPRFTMITGYYCLSFNTSQLHTDPYISCFISAAVEVPAYISSWLALRYVPRRLSVIATCLLGAVSLFFIQMVPQSKQKKCAQNYKR